MLETRAGANGGGQPSVATRRLVDAVGLSCTLGYAALAFLAWPPGEPDLVAFFILMAWTGLPVFGLFLYCHRRDEPFPLGHLLFWAVAFRICGLVGGPLFEDDFYRYLWDGYRFATTGTPYAAVPEAFLPTRPFPPRSTLCWMGSTTRGCQPSTLRRHSSSSCSAIGYGRAASRPYNSC